MFLVGMAIVLDAICSRLRIQRMKFAKPLAYPGLLRDGFSQRIQRLRRGRSAEGNCCLCVLVAVAMGGYNRVFSSGRLIPVLRVLPPAALNSGAFSSRRFTPG